MSYGGIFSFKNCLNRLHENYCFLPLQNASQRRFCKRPFFSLAHSETYAPAFGNLHGHSCPLSLPLASALSVSSGISVLEKRRFLQHNGIRRRPTLPGRFQPSTISVWRLNFCVRYGNRWIPPAIVTGNRMHFSNRLLSCSRSFPRPAFAFRSAHPENCTGKADLSFSNWSSFR